MKTKALAAALFLVAALVQSARGQTFWTDGTGNWNTAGNWSLGVPNVGSGTAFDAVIENGGTAQLTSAPAGSVRRFRVGRAAGAGNVLVDAATLSVTQDLFLNESGVATSSMTVRNGSTVTAPTTSVGQSSAAPTNFTISGASTTYTANTQFIVANTGAGTASLTVDTGAALISASSIIGNSSGTTGIATVHNPGSIWTTTGSLTVGSSGAATLNVQDLGTAYVGSTLSIGSLGTINLGGGILRFNGYSRSGTINYTSGIVQLAGDRTISLDLAIADFFGVSPSIPSGKDLEVEGGVDTRINVNVNGGALRSLASGNFMRIGFGGNSVVSISGGGTVAASGQLLIGYPVGPGFSGTVTVSGAGSTLTSAGDFTISPSGPGTLQVSGGGSVTSSANALLATGSGSIATVTVTDANSAWTIGGSLSVGTSGAATVTIKDQGLIYVGTNLSINNQSTVNLQGGTLRFSTISSGLAQLNFSSGTIQLAGDRTIGADSTISTLFGASPVIPVGKGLTVEGAATIQSPLTINGGTLRAGSLAVNGPFQFTGGLLELTGGAITGLTSLAVPTSGEFRARGVQPLRIAGAAGSTITATGNLTIGDAAAVNGFYTDGTLSVGANTVTLSDANDAAFDGGALVTLGSGASPGTLNAANGLTLDFSGNLTGFGTISTPNMLAKPLINNGHVTGNSPGQQITLPGYVKGVGTFDNVNFTGTFSPGLSPTILSVGNVGLAPTSTLIMELGGTSPGSGYDEIVSSGSLSLGGTLQVALTGGFTPAAGQSFNLFDWASASGTFSTLQLPALGGSLVWSTNRLYSEGVLAVVDSNFLPGDVDRNGQVNIADVSALMGALRDLSTYQDTHGPGGGALTQQQLLAIADLDYDGAVTNTDVEGLINLLANGFGSGGGSVTAVPEPSTKILALFGIVVAGFFRRGLRS